MERLGTVDCDAWTRTRRPASSGRSVPLFYVCYFATLTVVRLDSKRFGGTTTAFDVLLGIILGSVVDHFPISREHVHNRLKPFGMRRT